MARLPQFTGPFIRIGRVRQHIAELARVEQAFLNSTPFEVIDQDDESGRQQFVLHLTRPPPEEVSAIIHDVLAGLGSSLDNAVCSAALAAGSHDLRHTYFHVASTEAEWLKSVKGRTRAAPLETVNFMQASKPWQGGNDLLYALSRLSVADKHQTITSFANRHTHVEVDAKMIEPPGQFTLHIPEWYPEFNATLLAQCTAGRIEVRVARFDASLGFYGTETMAGEPIVLMFDAMARLCEDLVYGIKSVTLAARGS